MLKLQDFDFNLPQNLIAQEQASPRDACRLMVVDRNKKIARLLPPSSIWLEVDTPENIIDPLKNNSRKQTNFACFPGIFFFRLEGDEVSQSGDILENKIVWKDFIPEFMAQDSELLKMGDGMLNDNPFFAKLFVVGFFLVG